VGSDVRVKVEKSRRRFNTYPDISIACPPFRFEEKRSGVKDTLLNPRVLVEVLSPSTEKFDRTEKFDEYKLIESLTDYLLIEQERVRVEHYRRTENNLWTVESYTLRADTFALPGLEITLSLDEIYEGVDVSEAPMARPANEDED
jgi:Uma2 family endonuclease